MTDTPRGARVFVDLNGTPVLAGRLRVAQSRGAERVAFHYDDTWLGRPSRFALEPALHLDSGAQYPPQGRALFGAFGDSAPDRWGRMLIARAERRRAERAGQAPRALHEADYLLGVNDETRHGALRFTAPDGGPFLAAGTPAVPPLVDLPRLLAASDRIETDSDTDEDLALLLAPGSSLGGARPKASVREGDGTLAIAKFPRSADDYPVEAWEMVAVALARKAAVTVTEARLAHVAGRAVLVARRFDRRANRRVPYLSMMTLLGATVGDERSYPEMADALRQHGAHAGRDLEQLFRRTVFTVLISNTDDHLRNHGVLFAGADGWELSPAFDLNPTPTDVRPRVLSTSLTLAGDRTASLPLALEAHEHYDLSLARARAIAAEVGAAVAEWRAAARQLGLKSRDCDRMASAFEHEDAAAARRMAAVTVRPRS